MAAGANCEGEAAATSRLRATLTVHGPHNVDPRPLRSGANTQFTAPMVRPILHAAKTPTGTCTLLALETTTVIPNY